MAEKEEEEKQREIEKKENEERRKYMYYVQILGQEKVYNEEEKNFILKIVKLIRDSMENLEIKLLD